MPQKAPSDASAMAALVLANGHTPSVDYFVRPHLERQGVKVVVRPARGPASTEEAASRDSGQRWRLVVVSRYLSWPLLRELQALRQAGARVAYFMDDDLFDLRAWEGTPWRYRWKLLTGAWVFRRELERLTDEVWVSSPFLAAKYAHLKPIVISPRQIQNAAGVASSEPVKVCYHGTASHAAEADWLQEVMERVLALRTSVHFEIFGGRRLARRFSSLPRTTVLHPLPWPQYLAYTQASTADIGLAPLLPQRFNAARSATKCFDYSRMGALGIYSNVDPYLSHVRHGVDGCLLENDRQRWIDTILELAENKPKRHAMQTHAVKRFGGELPRRTDP